MREKVGMREASGSQGGRDGVKRRASVRLRERDGERAQGSGEDFIPLIAWVEGQETRKVKRKCSVSGRVMQRNWVWEDQRKANLWDDESPNR